MSAIIAIGGDYKVGVLKGVGANDIIVVPAFHRINSIEIVGTNANAVTGGIKIGTTSGGTDVVAAQAVAGNSFNSVSDATLLKRYFSETYGSNTALYIQAVTGWNSAILNVYITMMRLTP